MRIAFIGQKGIPVSQGGVERHVEELAIRLNSRGHDVLVYSRKTYIKGDRTLPRGIKVVDLPSIPLKAWDTIVHTFLATLDVLFRKVDVIHYHSIGPAFFIFLPRIFKPSAKIVFTHHTYETQRPQWGPLARSAMHLGEFVGMHLAHEVIGISPTVSEELEQKYNRRVLSVPNGVTFLKNDGPGVNVQLPDKYILAVSRLIRSKGLDHLVNAFHLIANDYPDYHLIIVGSPTRNDNDIPRLKKLINKHPRIKIFGWQDSSTLDSIYKSASVFVQPSEIEGLPITLLEAALYGVPIIASDIPEHKIVLRNDGEMFKSRNQIDLASKLRLVLNNLPERRLEAQRLTERVKREFNWDSITNKIIKIYSTADKGHKDLVAKWV